MSEAKSAVSASRPPAEAPMPTTAKGARSAAGGPVASAASPSAGPASTGLDVGSGSFPDDDPLSATAPPWGRPCGLRTAGRPGNSAQPRFKKQPYLPPA